MSPGIGFTRKAVVRQVSPASRCPDHTRAEIFDARANGASSRSSTLEVKTLHRVIAGVHLHDQRGPFTDRALIIGQVRSRWWSRPSTSRAPRGPPSRPAIRNDPADLDQFRRRENDHLPGRVPSAASGQQHGPRRWLFTTVAASAPVQPAQTAGSTRLVAITARRRPEGRIPDCWEPSSSRRSGAIASSASSARPRFVWMTVPVRLITHFELRGQRLPAEGLQRLQQRVLVHPGWHPRPAGERAPPQIREQRAAALVRKPACVRAARSAREPPAGAQVTDRPKAAAAMSPSSHPRWTRWAPPSAVPGDRRTAASG